ncbi:nuclease-related domain-containing protein [Desulforamulus ruminis]|uniref:NERD domain protein n=1 Tax=Desulforamulus ruminis (strain ATCC 23193 / DSM 2154 / NCIMB 8452 / DL) TaxID=696281 RepID=F6DQF6_DESRL|nr:nuclease-related domain-containing protein [Desulforamulus ruminis]AEG60850.1 NERD domain protein [Desulforamulus ruminis DSM 2154]
MATVLKWPGKEKSKAGKPPSRSGVLGFFLGLFDPVEPMGKGLAGEIKVARQLSRDLGDAWIIINDFKIITAGGRTQIDHLVLGPPGIFCLETKNWQTAACNDQGHWFRWQRGGWLPQKSPVEQNQGKIKRLEEMLKPVDAGVKVQGIIVFANPGKFDFSLARLPDDTKVFGLPGLLQWFNGLEQENRVYSKEALEKFIPVLMK